MNFDIEKIIKDVEIKSTLLIDMDYLEIITVKMYEQIDKLEKDNNYLELIKVYYLLALELNLKNQINESITWWEKSLEIAKKLNNNFWSGKIYSRLSSSNMKKNNYTISRRLFIKSITLLKKENNIQQITLVYIQRLLAIRWQEKNKNIIRVYLDKILGLMKIWQDKEHGYYYIEIATTYVYFLNEHISSMKYFMEGMKVGEKYGIIEMNALVLYYLGSIYLDYINNPSEAIRNLQPLIYNSKYDFMNKELKGSSFVALIDAYIDEDKLEDARECINYGNEYLKYINYNIDEGTKIMLIYLEAKLISKGDKNIEKGLEYALSANDRYEKNLSVFKYTHFDCNINNVIGDLYFKLDDNTKSIEYYQESIKNSKKWGSIYEKNAYYSLARVYEYQQNYKEALKYYKICESIFSEFEKQYCFIQYENLNKEFEKIYKEEEIKNLDIYNSIMKEESYRDELTKLFNRCYLNEIIKNNVSLKNISVIMVDIDYFKYYNDNYGHIKGDKALISVSQSIKNSCRECEDEVIRYGGEEFLIISYSQDNDYIKKLPYEILKNINSLNIEHDYSKVKNNITVSIGVSCGDINSSDDYNVLIKQADKALYISKEQGRNRVTQNEI
jgi:diguanylate cyclase (GGDEF)-like protein